MSIIDSKGVHRADTTKGPPLRILSLDGGGVRGYSMFILLEEIMHQTYVEMHGSAPRRQDMPKPCDHFDLIIGTGTGGLIAIMLGRLRMDLSTCKEVYVRMTRRVFETDKTFAGIPYRSTLFKASKMEEAIRECVAEHTVSEAEGNDSLANAQDLWSPVAPGTPHSGISSASGRNQRSMSQSSRFSSDRRQSAIRPTSFMGRFGNPDTLLYDSREHRTKTAVTAVYRGAKKNSPPALLRSYDSRKEAPPDSDVTIWQAGRATTAIGLAFKPIQVGQSWFSDEGAGRFNPTPEAIDEAVAYEWPGRDVGVLLSIGTGKRPSGSNDNSHQWYESFLGGALGDFAEARRRLFAKIEGCEETHQYLLRDGLSRRHVNVDNYYRLNVEVGVGEFGMNEWNRLAEISQNSKMYLSQPHVQSMNRSASTKLARIFKAKQRWDRAANGNVSMPRNSWEVSSVEGDTGPPPPSNPIAIEMPGDSSYTDTLTTPTQPYQQPPPPPHPTQSYQQPVPPAGTFLSPTSPTSNPPYAPTPAISDDLPQVVDHQFHPRPPPPLPPQQQQQQQQQQQHQLPPSSPPSDADKILVSTPPPPPRLSPPPLPPKTPVGFEDRVAPPPPRRQTVNPPPMPPPRPPYPDDEADIPPPLVNMSKKPQW